MSEKDVRALRASKIEIERRREGDDLKRTPLNDITVIFKATQNRQEFEGIITDVFTKLGANPADIFNGNLCTRREENGVVTYHFAMGFSSSGEPMDEEDLATHRMFVEGIKATARKTGGEVFNRDATVTRPS